MKTLRNTLEAKRIARWGRRAGLAYAVRVNDQCSSGGESVRKYNHGLRGCGSLTLPNMLWRRTLVKPIRDIRGLEKIGMRASAGQFEDENVIFDLVDEKPIRGDVTFAMVCPVAGERMVSVGGRQRFAVGELGDDGLQLRNRKMSLESLFVVPGVCSCGANAVLHFSRSFQRSSRLSYVGQLGSLTMRSPSSIAAMVSALGTCGASMMKGIRRSRTTVLMYTVMTDDAESPTSSQKSVNCFLVGASSENVMLAIVISPNYYSNVCELYTNLTPLVKWIGWVDNHGLHGCASLTFGKPKKRQALAQPIRVIRGSKNTLVPVGVGARDEHPRMADGENVYLIADDFVRDAIGMAEGLAKCGQLELARGVDVHQRVTDGQNFATVLLAAVENPVTVMLAKEFPQFRAIQFGEGLVSEVWLVCQQPDRFKNLVFKIASVFGIELVLEVETIRLDALLGASGEDDLHTATRRRAVLDLRRRSSLARRLLTSFSKSSRETVSPRSASPSATRRSSYVSIFSSFSCSSSQAQASTNTPAARPFCVSRSGLWLVRHCATHSESLARNSERDRISSEDLKENMVFAPLTYDLNIVQNSVDVVNDTWNFKEVA